MIIGTLQIVIGILFTVLAYLIFYNPNVLPARSILNIQDANIAFFILILSIIGFFSVLSGLLIIYDWLTKD